MWPKQSGSTWWLKEVAFQSLFSLLDFDCLKRHFVRCCRCEAHIKRAHGGADVEYFEQMFVSSFPLKELWWLHTCFLFDSCQIAWLLCIIYLILSVRYGTWHRNCTLSLLPARHLCVINLIMMRHWGENQQEPHLGLLLITCPMILFREVFIQMILQSSQLELLKCPCGVQNLNKW
jgi:hypothetical protein